MGWLGKDSVGIMGVAGTPPLFTKAAFCCLSCLQSCSYIKMIKKSKKSLNLNLLAKDESKGVSSFTHDFVTASTT